MKSLIKELTHLRYRVSKRDIIAIYTIAVLDVALVVAVASLILFYI